MPVSKADAPLREPPRLFALDGASPMIARPPRNVVWEPKEDITTYELAIALNVLVMAGRAHVYDAAAHVEGLPPNVQRHFVIGL